MADEANTDKTGIAPLSRRAVVTTAAQAAVTAPAVTLLLNAASKSAFAQISPYAAAQNHILDDITFGNEEADIDGAVFANFNSNVMGNQDDHL